ncbi:hypothetical protein [Leptolyngbya sp. PCC 6406]|uniref:hypothetical protein n=1 Tax=Leptolyngbya sp. PCC 6406 TaxID=1173264 RepID=UPI0002AC15A0|nr:hypothetical protein [Leptolyngbya sp. PCC 6406]
MADMSGTWLGTYWQRGEPTRFEATLVQGGNTLSGRILDDGPLGAAHLTGEVVGRRVQFTKHYGAAPNSPIDYTGQLSEEGNYVHGQWRIGTSHTGMWEARREVDTLTADLNRVLEKRVPATAAASRG